MVYSVNIVYFFILSINNIVIQHIYCSNYIVPIIHLM
jgi:hypothetical protein